MPDRFRQHWPDSLGNAKPEGDGYTEEYFRERVKDFDRTGHMQTSDGVRIYPEQYVVISERDVQRVAKAAARSAVDAYIAQVRKSFEKTQYVIGPPQEMTVISGPELSDLAIERISDAVVKKYQEQVNIEWEKLQGQTILEPIEFKREELSDSEIERIAYRIKELIVG